VSGAAVRGDGLGTVGTDAPIQRAEFGALGTEVDVRCTAGADLDAALDAVRAELDAIDLACSRFRGDSELSRVNIAGGRPVPVSPLLAEAVAVALRAAALTDGLVDPTVGTALCDIGYAVDFAAMPPSGPPLALVSRPVPGWRRVELDLPSLRLRIPAGVRLDLGATAKALAADRCAAAAAHAAGGSVLVSLGGDIAVGGPIPDRGWTVRLAAGTGDDNDGELVLLRGGGLATSGTTARRWTRGGHALHHIVDPRTSLPVPEVWTAVSVVAAGCVDANIASTAAMVLGDAAPEWLRQRGLAARLCTPDGAVHHVGPWALAAEELG
jgi:FAD:protein FMN transferase